MRELPASELAWKLADYQAAGEEAPDRLLAMPEFCEGELMTDDEIVGLISDSVATIMLLGDRRSERTAEVFAAFVSDLTFLLSIGRLGEDEYNELSNPENYSF